MRLKLTRILGITGGALTLLTYLVLIGYCVRILALPDGGMHNEGKGLAFVYLFILLVPTLISAAGFTGSFLVGKKHILAGVMMIVSGALTISLSIGFAVRFRFIQMLQMNTLFVALLFLLPHLLLIFAGILSLVSRLGQVWKPATSEETP